MLVQRSDTKHLICDSDKITFVWSSDGWCYNIEKKVRRKFFSTNKKDVFQLFEEHGIFVITDVQHQETLDVSIISINPRIWQEGTDTFCVIESNC